MSAAFVDGFKYNSGKMSQTHVFFKEWKENNEY